MTRRIALAVMALVTLLLVLAVVPLGLSLAGRERASFRDSVVAADQALAAAAEEHLSDKGSDASMHRLLERVTREGDCGAVFDATAREVAATMCAGQGATATAETRENWLDLGRRAVARGSTLTDEQDDRLAVALPVGDTAHPVGASVLSRSAEPVNRRITAMWTRLGAVGLGGLAAGALLAAMLARWVGRPLRAVNSAARELGEGRLDARASGERGPAELRRLAATFNTMAARTETLIHDHRAMVADVSHQLRTPLAALRLRLDVLAADANEVTAAELVAAQEEVLRLSRLVDGLLAVARAENAVSVRRPVRIDRVVQDRIAAWTPVAQERRVALSARCPLELTGRIGDGDLEQVLDNLIANALDAVAEGAHVRIDGRAHGDRVVLTVTDDGPGMSTAAKATAFHRFGNPETSGTGLGLAIVHRLLTSNGGTVRLEDTPGGGLTVVLELISGQP